MKAGVLVARLQHLIKTHGDMSVYMDVDSKGLREIGEVDVDADDTGIIFWEAE
jgi:hypothetical protein